MPFYYDVNRSTTTNPAVGTETTHLWAATVSNQQSMGLYAVYFRAVRNRRDRSGRRSRQDQYGPHCRRWNRNDPQGSEPSCPGGAERLEK